MPWIPTLICKKKKLHDSLQRDQYVLQFPIIIPVSLPSEVFLDDKNGIHTTGTYVSTLKA